MLYPIISSLLMGVFQGTLAGRRTLNSRVDASIRRVAAGVWKEVGDAHGLTLEVDPGLALHGTARGVECEIWVVGEGGSTFTLGRSQHGRSLGGQLALAPESLGRAVAAGVMRSRVRTGDPDLDESFVLVSDPPELADVFLGHEVRAALLAMRARNPHVSIRDDRITIELEGTEMVHENLHAIVALLSSAPTRSGPTPYRAIG